MANEAVLIQDLEYRHLEVTMADGSSGTDVVLGTILKWSDPNLGAASSADGDIFCGILLVDNEGGDGTVRYSVDRHSVWDIKLTTATVSTGDLLNIQGTNLVAKANVTTAADFAEIMGRAMQDGANDEVIEVLLLG